jgi:hypothetical protein
MVKESGDYVVYLRVFKSPEGGSLGIRFNDEDKVDLNTKSSVSGFEWLKVYDGLLEAGMNKMHVWNNKGFNAVNVGYYSLKGSSKNENYLEDKGIMYIYEAENEFEIQDAAEIGDAQYSNGLAVSLNNSSKLWSMLHTYSERVFYTKYKGKNVTIKIDGKNVSDSGDFLENGDHPLDIVPLSENASLDYLVVYDKKARDLIEGLKNGDIKEKGSVNYERTGRTSYLVQANIKEPSLLVFTSNYNDRFTANINDTYMQPIPVYSIINAFPINQTGNFKIEIDYDPQKWFDIGLILSLLSALLISIHLIKRWKHG